MSTINNILEKFFFSVHNTKFLIPLLVCFVIIAIQLYRFSVQDLKYREIKSYWQILSLYPLAIFTGYAMYGISFDFFFGFFSLLLYFYIVELYNYIMARSRGMNESAYVSYIGGADILCAPLYTVWFGSGVLIFVIIFLLVLVIATTKKVKGIMDSLVVDKEILKGDRIALLPCMFMSYLVCLLLYFLV